MSAAKEKMTFHGLEPLICDADNQMSVVWQMLDNAGFNCNNHVITEHDRELICFAINVASSMTRKVREAYFEAWEVDASKEAAE